MKKFEYLRILLISIIIICIISSILILPNLIKPEVIHAEPITLTTSIIALLGSFLIVLGLEYYDNITTLQNSARGFWYSLSETMQQEIAAGMAWDGATGLYKLDVSDELWQVGKEFVYDNYNTGEYPVPVTDYSGIQSPWVVPYNTNMLEGINWIDGGAKITSQQYFDIHMYEMTYWADSDSGLHWVLWDEQELYDCWRLQILQGTTNRYVSDLYWGVTYYNSNYSVYYENRYDDYNKRYLGNMMALNLDHRNAIGGTYGWLFITKGSPQPYFSYFYDVSTRIYRCVVAYQDYMDDDKYKLVPYIYMSDVSVDQLTAEQAADEYDIDVQPNQTVIGDIDYLLMYDILLNGLRQIYSPTDLSRELGLSIEDVLAREFADTNIGITHVDLVLQRILERLKSLDRLDSISISSQGAIAVTMETTAQWELDIPETEFQIPTLELLATKFPFCIPFDLYFAVVNLVATPEAPVFEVNFPASIFGGEADMELDFGIFENIAVVIRWIILLGFVISLIILTRKLIRG